MHMADCTTYAYPKEIEELTRCCQNNNLLYIWTSARGTRELIVAFRKKHGKKLRPPIQQVLGGTYIYHYIIVYIKVLKKM